MNATLFESLLGRDEELRFLLERHAATARETSGSLVLIAGEAGIGKSRLLAEFAAKAGTKRDGLVRIACDPSGQRAFAPLMGVLGYLETRRDAAVRDLARDAIRTLTKNDGTSILGAAERRHLRFTVLAEALTTAAKRLTRLTIVVDDAHWADLDSLEAIRFCAARSAGAPLLFIVAYRPDELAHTYSRAAVIGAIERDGADRIALPKLSNRDVLVALSRVLPGAPSASLRDLCALAEGLPYVAEELARSASVSGTLGQSVTLRDAVLERARTLSADQRAIISRAAVFGRTIRYDDLGVLGSFSSVDIIVTLRAARDLQLIVEIEDREAPAFAFRHALSREIFYEDLAPDYRRELHAAIATYLEDYPGRRAEFAYHLWSSTRSERALVACEAAGDDALGVTAFGDAVSHYERAFSIAEVPALPRIGEKLVQASIAAGDPRIVECGDSVAKRLIAAFEREAAARTYFTLAETLSPLYRVGEAEDMLVRGAALLDEDSSPEIRFEHELSTLVIRNRQTRFSHAREAMERAEALLHVATPTARLRFDYAKAMLCHEDGSVANVSAELQACLKRARELGETAIESETLRALGQVAYVYNYQESLRWNELSLAARERSGALATAEQVRANLAVLALVTGDIARGARYVEAAAKRALLTGPWVSARLMLARYLGEDMKPYLAMLDDPELSESPWIYAMVCINAVWALSPPQAEALIARGVAKLQPETYGGKFAYSVVRFGSNDDFARVRDVVVQTAPARPLAQADRLLFDAATAARERRGIESIAKARLAVERFTSIGDWLGRAHALELSGEKKAAIAILHETGATAELARFTAVPVGSAAAKGEAALSVRERQVAELIVKGLTTADVAKRLGIGKRTVETHRLNIYAKLGISSKAQLFEIFREA